LLSKSPQFAKKIEKNLSYAGLNSELRIISSLILRASRSMAPACFVTAIRSFAQQTGPALRQTSMNQFRRVPNRQSGFVLNLDAVRMTHPLRNHQPVDAIRRQILHVAIEQACAFAVQDPENAISIPNLRPLPQSVVCQRRRKRAADRDGLLAFSGSERQRRSLLDGYMEDLATDRIYRLMIAQRVRHSDSVEIQDESGLPISATRRN